MEEATQVTMIPLAGTGTGKSSMIEPLTGLKNGFKIDDCSSSVTSVTSSYSNNRNGTLVNVIDNPGFLTGEGKDKVFMPQMHSFLKNWIPGINLFLILLSAVNSRIDKSVETMFKFIDYFFNDANMWKQVGIVFTKCIPNQYNKEKILSDHFNKIISIIKELPSCRGKDIDLNIPVFCVNSPDYYTDESTRSEYERIIEYAKKFDPVSTKNLRQINPDYMMVEYKVNEKVKVDERIEGNEEVRKRIITYQNQRKPICLSWEHVQYELPLEIIDSWEEEQVEKLEIRPRILKSTDIINESNCVIKLFHYQDLKRYRIDFEDGRIGYTEDEVISEYTEKQKEEIKQLPHQFIKAEYKGEERNKIKILYFEDQEQTIVTMNDGEPKFLKPKTIRPFTEVIKSKVHVEFKTEEINRNEEEIYHWEDDHSTAEKVGMVFGWIFSVGIYHESLNTQHKVHDYWEVTVYYRESKRDVITDPDGNVIYCNWVTCREWNTKHRK